MSKFLLRSVAAAALIVFAAPSWAQNFSADVLSQNIRTISADDFEGRYPGTEGERKTLEWLQAQYEAMGLEPGAPDGQWLQRVDLQTLSANSQNTALVRIGGADAITVGTADGLVLRAMNEAGTADVENLPLVFAGYGISAPERGWDDYGDADLTGKIVVVVNGSPSFGSPYRTFFAQDDYKADEAFRRGAKGLIIIAKTNAERSLGGRQRTIRLSPGTPELAVRGWMTPELAQGWGISADDLEHLDDAAATVRDLGVTLSTTIREEVSTLTTYNLIARLTGTEFPDETVIFSAHWDHVGVDSDHAVGEDNIFNGMWDNASGTVGVVEMAKQFAENGPSKRTVIFLHATAEEMGLLGTYAYTANPVYPLETTVADINIDMLPLSGPTRDVPIFGYGQNTLEDMLDVLAKAEGRYVSDDGQPEQGFYYRSDHFPFARAGVPALMPWHGVDWIDGGIEAGKAAWHARFGRVYHKPSDEWSEDLDFTSAVENLTLIYRLGRELADSRVWPEWKSTSEFGQVRARSDAARADRR